MLCKLILNNLKSDTNLVDILFFTFLLLIAAVMLLTAAADIGKKCATNLDGKLVGNIDGGVIWCGSYCVKVLIV